MHIPDGVLPVWLWLSGIVVMAAALGLCFYRARSMDMKIKVPLLGALSAAMLVGMSIPILPGYHINLSVVTGILIGPSLGFVAAFIANLILSLMGHGGYPSSQRGEDAPLWGCLFGAFLMEQAWLCGVL